MFSKKLFHLEWLPFFSNNPFDINKGKLNNTKKNYAVPIAQNYQVIDYVVLLVVFQVLMDASKKGEMFGICRLDYIFTECGFSM